MMFFSILKTDKELEKTNFEKQYFMKNKKKKIYDTKLDTIK